MQQSALKAGEVHYVGRVDDIRVLKIKIKDMLRETTIGKGSGDKSDTLKRAVLHLQR